MNHETHENGVGTKPTKKKTFGFGFVYFVPFVRDHFSCLSWCWS